MCSLLSDLPKVENGRLDAKQIFECVLWHYEELLLDTSDQEITKTYSVTG